MMTTKKSSSNLPAIPPKRYFTIGEVADLCALKPHVLRYWEQEFSQLHPAKRSGNRRYYQREEVLLVRRIRSLLYEQGFTISGARHQLQEKKSNKVATDNTAPSPQFTQKLQSAIRDLESVLEIL